MRILILLNKIKLPVVALISLLLLWLSTRHMVINTSVSMPIGFYWKIASNHIAPGDIVIVCLPKALAKSAYDAGIIHKSEACPHGYQPLLKQVIATANDIVVSDNQNISVNGKYYVAPITANRPVFNTRGTPDFKQTGIWLYGAGSPNNSWDSRYFGAMDISSIQSTVRGLWIQKPHYSFSNQEVNHG